VTTRGWPILALLQEPALSGVEGVGSDAAGSAGFNLSENASGAGLKSGSTRISAPLLSTVVNPQHFDVLLPYAIDSDVGQGREQELSGPFLASGTAEMRPLFQRLDGGIHSADGCVPVVGMVLSEIITDSLQVHGGGWRPPDAHL